MAQTTWKQVVLDTADAIREANGTSDKIPVGQIADKVRAGAGTPYEGDNPLTIGQTGFIFPAKTLLKDGLQIINGVNGEDLTEPVAVQETAVETLLREVKRRVADHKGEGQYVWKKYEIIPEVTITNPSFTAVLSAEKAPTITIQNANFDTSLLDSTLTERMISFFEGFTTSDGNKYFKVSSGVLYHQIGSGNRSVSSFDKATLTMQLSSKTTATTAATETMTYTGTKLLKAEERVYVDYVVSGDADAYPDCGELDGYWYELVEETNLASELGFENVAIDKFTFSSEKAAGDGTVVTHSLGEVPKFSVVLSADRACVANNVYIGATGKITGDNKRGWAVLMGSYNSLKGTGGELSGTVGTFTENSITPLPITYSSYKYSAGVEYTLITMA